MGTSQNSARPRDRWGYFKKRKVSDASRRAVARRYGGLPHQTVETRCHYCDVTGRIHWITPSWVWFEGLEIDHVVPEYHGGEGTPDNLVLACRPCNRRKGTKITVGGAL